MIQTSKKSRIIKAMAVALAFCLTMGIAQKTVMAASSGYTSFPYIFNGGTAIPSSSSHITQTVEVSGNANASASAECTSYSSTVADTSKKATLKITSVSSAYPTETASFKTTGSKDMAYTSSIPPKSKTVTFQGTVSNYGTSFTMVAAVKG